MNKLFAITFIIAILLLIFTSGCGSRKGKNQTDLSNQQTNPTENQQPAMPALNDENHLADWKIIDSLEQEGLPQSALEKVKILYNVVKKENNPAQIIKCLIYRGKYESQLEEDGLVNAIAKIKTEIDTAGFPVKPLLQSLLAEMYSMYLANNYWKFADRTQTTGFKNEDIRTWTVEQLVAESRRLYFSSVADLKTQQIEIEKYKAILEGGDQSELFRPTLYDFLMHRAIDYLANENTYLTEPAYKFYINQKEALGSVDDFINFKFSAEDEQSPKFRTLLLFQNLLGFHKNDKDPKALIDADLKRLNFVYNNTVLADKDALYLGALTNLEQKYADLEQASEISFNIANYYYQKAQNYTPNPENEGKWDYKTAYEICQKAIEKHPGSFGATQCEGLKSNISNKELTFQSEIVNLPDRPFLGLVNYRNVAKAYFKLVKISEKEEDNIRSLPYDERVQYFQKLDPLKTWSAELPDDGDFRAHSVEVKMDALPFGRYMVVVSNNENYLAGGSILQYLIFQVSNLSYQSSKDEKGNTRFVVLHRETGAPMGGVTAEFYLDKYNPLKRERELKKNETSKTDKDGFVTSSIEKEQSFQVKFINGSDELFLPDYFSDYFYQHSNRQVLTHFFLDRAIYRPGQTIFFKGIVIGYDDKRMPTIHTKEKVTVTFYNANNQKVSSLDLVTNEYGSVSGTFIAPETGLLGGMRLQSSIGSQSSVYFQVEEYKRPKFEVTFQPVEGSFKLNEKVTVKGKAKAYAGSNIDAADVAYRVVREARFPYLPWYFWRGYYPTSPSMEIAFGQTMTNENGEFTIEFEAIPDLSIAASTKPEFNYTVYADVIDITGETHSADQSVSVGYIALHAGIDLPELSNLDSLKNIKIFTRNLNGQPEPAKGTLSIESLLSPGQTFVNRYWERPDNFIMSKEDFKKDFPNFAYQDEDLVEKWKVDQTVFSGEFDTGVSQLIDLKSAKLKPGKYALTLKTKDKFNQEVEVKRFITLYDLDLKKTPSNETAFYVQERNSFEPENTADFYIGTAEKGIKVLYEVEHNEKIVERRWLDVQGLEKLSIPILEKHRGNLMYYFTFVKNNRAYLFSKTVVVPWSNKDLKIEYSTFRDKLYPGQKEEWRIKISGPKKERVTAEMLAGMYDASLDQFAPHGWSLDMFPTYYSRLSWYSNGFFSQTASLVDYYWSNYGVSIPYRDYHRLNWFNFVFYEGAFMRGGRKKDEMLEEAVMLNGAAPAAPDEDAPKKSDRNGVSAVLANGGQEQKPQAESGSQTPEKIETPPQIRTNLKETVFFFPDLMTDYEGNVIIKFTMNEALTRWKFLGLAHTKDLKFALTQKEIVTQKDLMVFPNPPRFFRESDEIEYTAKVTNLTDKDLEGTAELRLFDAISMAPVDQLLGNDKITIPFKTKAGQSDRLAWKLKIPVGKVPVLTHRVVAKSGDFSDGEESSAPVLTNRMLVTETKPLPVRGNQTKDFTFEAMQKASKSNTLQHHKYTLEFTSNPAWYAVQALPYIMEYPYECTEQIFNRFYANSLATSVANSHPKIKAVFDRWKGTPAMQSNLSKNQELKTALLEETPWVLQAQSEEEQKRNIGLLFDLNKMSNEQAKAMNVIADRQLSNGGFAWFPGGEDNWYITQYIVEGMGHLDQLGVKSLREDQKIYAVITNAVHYIDDRLLEHYQELKNQIKRSGGKMEDDHLDWIAMHYLYARTYFLEIEIPSNLKEAFDYYKKQAEQYWLNKGMYAEGMIALSLSRLDNAQTPAKIVKSLKERSLNHEELGMYWKYNTGYFWYQLPIETHALMIEVFDEVAKDTKAVDDLKVWLLKNKQTTHWKTTKGTAAAVYALLRSGENWLLEDQPVKITLGNKQIDQSQMQTEAGTGYFKTSWTGNDIQANMSQIKVENPNKVVAWGAAYWQYFEQLDKIDTFEETPLTLKKQLFLVKNSDQGPVMTPVTESSKLNPGDKLHVRIELRVDRDMEYVHMKDMRASGFEPVNVLSSYKWQGGLGYYESTRDASTNFFISWLPKGTYVFEYPLRVIHNGDFSNGITTIQCMYAPEFTSHSEGIRVKVGEE